MGHAARAPGPQLSNCGALDPMPDQQNSGSRDHAAQPPPEDKRAIISRIRIVDSPKYHCFRISVLTYAPFSPSSLALRSKPNPADEMWGTVLEVSKITQVAPCECVIDIDREFFYNGSVAVVGGPGLHDSMALDLERVVCSIKEKKIFDTCTTGSQ